MKYTAAQRAELYRRALESMKSKPPGPLEFVYGICSQIRVATGDGFNTQDFPEIMKRKPTEMDLCKIWWPLNKKGFDTRIKVLEEAIAEASGLMVENS